MRYLLLILIVFSSCGYDYHLKRSQAHYNKAIVKGYEPTFDTTKIASTLQPIQLTTDTVRKTRVLKGIDRIFIEKAPSVSPKVKQVILKQIDSVLIENKAFVNYDSIHTLPTGSKIHAKIKDGVLKLSVVEAKTEERIFMKESIIKYLPHLIFLVAALIIAFKLVKK
jgi:hypothetical protein